MILYPNSVTITPHEGNLHEDVDSMFYVKLYNIATNDYTLVLCPNHDAAEQLYDNVVSCSVYTN